VSKQKSGDPPLSYFPCTPWARPKSFHEEKEMFFSSEKSPYLESSFYNASPLKGLSRALSCKYPIRREVSLFPRSPQQALPPDFRCLPLGLLGDSISRTRKAPSKGGSFEFVSRDFFRTPAPCRRELFSCLDLESFPNAQLKRELDLRKPFPRHAFQIISFFRRDFFFVSLSPPVFLSSHRGGAPSPGDRFLRI